MSLDKLVDSTQLDSDLTSVANAIRAKSGGSSQLAFPAGFVSEIGNIPTGGGGSIVEVNTMVTVSEMNSYNALAAMGVKLKYKKSFVMMTIVGDTAATGGSNYTNNNYFLVHNGTTVTSKDAKSWLQQKSPRVAPSTMAGQITNTSNTWYSSSDVVINSDGTFTFRASNAGIMIPAGATVVVTEIPTEYANGSIDLTLFGD